MDTRGGEMAMSFAEQLKNMGMEVSPENLLYLYQTWVGGPGNFVKRLFEVSSRIYNGEPIPKNQVPVLRRFYGDTPRKTFEARNYNEEVLDNLDNAYGTARAKATRLASSTFSKMQRKKTTAEKRLIVSDVIRENPDLAEAIVKSLNTKLEEASIGMTSADKRLKALPSLAKAEYFVDRLEDMPREQVPEYVRLMQQRKVLTPKVIKLVQELQALRSSAQ
jgi:HD-GYP domain-containing protein (c-di-GMP phosphodiesterase class II)